MNTKQIPFSLNFLLFLITLYLNLMAQWDLKSWENYSDTKDYLRQSTYSLFLKDFFFPKPEPGFYPRPFTVPLLYKIAGNRGETIVQMQKFMLSLSAFVLVYSFLLLMKTGISRYFVTLLIYLLMSWWNILGWTTQLLSESLSISFLFLWIGTFLIYYCKPSKVYLSIHAVTTILFSFTRDSWPYILLLLYGMMMLTTWLMGSKALKGLTFMLILSAAIFFIQGKSSEIGERTKLPVMNSIVLRVLPEPQYYAWFMQRGMPDAVFIRQVFRGIDLNKKQDVWKVYGMYTLPEYQRFRDWAATDGKKLYIRFLLTHPSYTFLLKEPPDKLQAILALNLNYYAQNNGYSLYTEYLLPVFSPGSFLIFILLVFMAFIRTGKPAFLLPLVFTFLFFVNVFFIYNADSMEVARHLFITLIMMQLICIWGAGILADEAIINFSSE